MNNAVDFSQFATDCLRATSDDAAFENFRRLPGVRSIVENVLPEQGERYLAAANTKSLVENGEFMRNDVYGNPEMTTYHRIGRMSPTTIRYIKILGEIVQLFGDLYGKRIVEVGVGYGGQCRILDGSMGYVGRMDYTLVDLEPVLGLAKKYLSRFSPPMRSRLTFKTLEQLDDEGPFDLFISNYALSELPREVQDVYIEKLAKKSRNGYVIFSDVAGHRPAYTSDELASILGAESKLEQPSENDANRLLLWKEGD